VLETSSGHTPDGPPITAEEARFREWVRRDRKPRILLHLLIQVAFWSFLFEPRGAYTGLTTIAPWAIGIVLGIFSLIQGGVLLGIFETIVNIEFVFSMLLALFSTLYWNYGSATNFSIILSRLDAVYFAIGTLTTAGTGNIAPISQTARGIQALQMILDLGLVVFAITLVLAAFSSRPKKARPL